MPMPEGSLAGSQHFCHCALRARCPGTGRPSVDDGLIHHSDRGVQNMAMKAPAPGQDQPRAVSRQRRRQRWQRVRRDHQRSLQRRSHSGVNGHGRARQRWKWPPCAGLTGPITINCSAPSDISRPPQTTMQPSRPSIWLHASNEAARGGPGMLQTQSVEEEDLAR